MTLISIIVPCYNVTSCIDRCLESLVKQTIGLENLELILVNDASTDATLDKLKEWESRYPDNILVITYEENLRQGGARNIGMQYASGEYIGFVDADDFVDERMYELLYLPIKEKEYDVVRGKFQYDYADRQHELSTKAARQDQSYVFEQVNGYSVWDVDKVGNCGEYGVIPSGIYRRNLLLENHLWFPEKRAYEDNYWGAILKLYAKDLYIVDEIVYHYCVNQGSTVHQRNAPHQLDRLAIEVVILKTYKERGMFEVYRDELEWNFIKRYYLNTMYILFTRFDQISSDIFEEMRKNVNQYFPDFYKNPRIDELNEREKVLLKLLRIPKTISQDELEQLKIAYLNTF